LADGRLSPFWAEALHRVPDRLATTAFDLMECVRAGRWLACVGQARQAIDAIASPIPQHPRYRGYWYDPSRNALVGMVLGLDIIQSSGRYYLLEMNLDAGLLPERHALYAERIDPLVAEIVAVGKELGFRRVVPYARHWSAEQVAEFIAAGTAAGVVVTPACFSFISSPGAEPITALPEALERDTFYLVFSSRHSPLDYYVHDKLCSARWFEAGVRASGDGLVRSIPTYTRMTIPPLHPDPRWPNLVAKLADFDMGQFVLMAKVRDEAEARAALGQDRPEAIPRAFRLSRLMRLGNFLTHRGHLIYQPFIPPDIDSDGLIRKLRLMLLVSPLASRFLSVHAAVSPPPDAPLGFGTVTRDTTLLLTGLPGLPRRRVERRVEEEAATAAAKIGPILDRAVRAKFLIGPA
ncbi:MAG: hypothetical protein HY203_06600, partial [Nitrospirae bacterium]|nr:hypothetical protein [Nitrospirota bacterium]